MIVDLHDLDDGVEIAADLCVVGTGPAGIAVARRFRDGPLDVVMLESGGLEPEPEARELNAGEVRGETYVDLREPRIRALGGTTGHWSGELGRLGDASFSERPWLGLPGWPIARAEIDARYEAALELCGGAPWPAGREGGSDGRERIVAAVERDFASGETVTVDGWIVARTTALLGALAALDRRVVASR